MKKIKEFVFENWIFVLFLIPFILICYNNKMPDNDIWFLLNNGRYVINSGIPVVDPFTIHEGLKYVMQQWGTSLFFWVLYKYFGGKAFIVFIYIISFLLMYLFYRLCYLVSDKKKLSVIITSITFCIIYDFIVTRPQVLTFMFLLLEILCLELYIKKDNIKYLIVLPFISLLLINFHTSMWWFQFIFLLPFICNGLSIFNLNFLKKYRLDKYRLTPIIIVAIFMFLFGFVNPYGVDAITFIFKSYGINSINNAIGEMKSLSFDNYYGKAFLGIIIFLTLLMHFRKDFKFDIRHLCFICGGFLLIAMHLKSFAWGIFIIMYSISYALGNIKIKTFAKGKVLRILKCLYNGVVISLSLFGLVTFGMILKLSFENYSFSQGILKNNYEEVTKYILNNYNKDDVILYVDFNNGGYTEFMGLKSYIDGRAELFVKKFNGKSDIFDEYVEILNDNIIVEDFIEKYKFTHLIVYAETKLDKYLKNSSDYDKVFESTEYIDEDGNAYMNLYVRNDIEVIK